MSSAIFLPEKILCVKTCISSTYHIAYEGEFYYYCLNEEDRQKDKQTYHGFPYDWINGKEVKRDFTYPVMCIYIPFDAYKQRFDNLGCFDKRNFITLAEYRNLQIDEILTETKLLK